MPKHLAIALTIICAALPAHLFAATPQAGTYIGTMTAKEIPYPTPEKLPFNQRATLVINADDSFTFEAGGFSISGTGVFGDTNGSLAFSSQDTIFTAPLRFGPKGNVKGTVHICELDKTQFFIDGKLSLKKQ
jgi:hypothetical protein